MKLTKRQQEVYELRAIKKLAHKDIANILGISDGTSRQIYHIACLKKKQAK